MSQGHRRKWGQRRQRVSGRPVDPGIRPKEGGGAGGGALEDSEQKSGGFVPFSPWVEYSLSEGRPCSLWLNHSSKYGFREVAEWSLYRDLRGCLPSSLWCFQWEDPSWLLDHLE